MIVPYDSASNRQRPMGSMPCHRPWTDLGLPTAVPGRRCLGRVLRRVSVARRLPERAIDGRVWEVGAKASARFVPPARPRRVRSSATPKTPSSRGRPSLSSAHAQYTAHRRLARSAMSATSATSASELTSQ